MAVLILEPQNYSPLAIESYARLGTVWQGDTPPGRESEVQLLVVRLAHRIDAPMLGRFRGLRAVASPTTGLTHLDLDLCAERGIRVFSLADCRQAIEEVTSTSELTIGLMIALLRSIPKAHQDIAVNGRWNRDLYRSRQLSRLRLGIVGLGRIGGHVARYAAAFGMNVLAHDPWQPSSRFLALQATPCSLAEVMAQADIVTLHANLRPDNLHLIGQAEIDLLRPTALLINTARGALVDESALADALRQGKLAGAAVDVLADEHSTEGWRSSPLLAAAAEGLNIIVTPHIGGCTSDAMHITEDRLAAHVVQALGMEAG